MRPPDGNTGKRIFISYSHADRNFAEKLAHALHEEGEDVWWDRWEILAGDSLVGKIFEEGLSNAAAFVVLLSPNSAQSNWVRQELDVATVRRIEGVTRIIPVLIDDVEVPSALRALLRVDMRHDFRAGVKAIINAVHGVTEKPPSGFRESLTTTLAKSTAGLSPAASTVGLFIIKSSDPDSANRLALTGSALQEALGLEPEIINDAVDELEEAGLVRTLKTVGTAPYDFYQLEPTYVLYRDFSEHLNYNPEDDVRVVAAAVASVGQINATALAKECSLSPGRLNRAVAYLIDYGLVEASQELGTFPYTFSWLRANRRTRQLAGSQ